MRRVLKGKEIGSLPQLWDALERELALEPEFGRNLDALWDALTGSVEGPLVIEWRDSDHSRRHLGDDFDRGAAILRQAAAERADLDVEFR